MLPVRCGRERMQEEPGHLSGEGPCSRCWEGCTASDRLRRNWTAHAKLSLQWMPSPQAKPPPPAHTEGRGDNNATGGTKKRRMEASNSKDLQEEEIFPKARGAFAELLHCSADWRRPVTSGTTLEMSKAVLLFYCFLIWMAFIFVILWMLLQTPVLSVLLFQVWRKTFQCQEPITKKDPTHS